MDGKASLQRMVRVVSLIAVFVGATTALGGVRTTVVADDGDRIVLDFEFDGYQSRTVEIQGAVYEEPWFPGEPVAMERGAPALPCVSRSVIVADDARMQLHLLRADYHETFARIAPSKGTLPRTVDPRAVPYVFGDAYAANAFHPAELATLGQPYILRDHRGITVRVHPLQWNPVTGVLRVHTRVRIELAPAGLDEVNVLRRTGPQARPSRSFQPLYRSHFLNAEERGALYAPLDEEGGMLVIAHDAWLANLQPFVAHKAAVGIDASLVGVSSIGNNPASIKSHIQTVYDGTDLAFVLLVGDIQQVASPDVLGGASDSSYSKLAGSDDYPEVIIGRFSAATVEQLETQLERTIQYESLPANEQAWFWKGSGIASAEGAGIGDEGQSDKQHMDQIRNWLLGAGYSAVDQIYDPGASDALVAAAVDAGRGVINYTGHGWPFGWSTSGFDNADVHALTNLGALPFVFSVACNNGEFESYDECFAEAWLRATHDDQPAGAIGVYASSISQYWAEPMEAQDEFNLLLTDPSEPYFSLGALCFAGSCSMMDDYGQSGADMFDTWVLFGDPSLRVIGNAAPHGLLVDPATGWSATGQAGGPFEPAGMQYTLHNLDAWPTEYAVATGADWVGPSEATGTIPPLGSVFVTLTLNDEARNLDSGSHASSVQFSNLTNHDGDTARPIALKIGLPMLQQRWNLDSCPFWVADAPWQFGKPLGQGGDHAGHPDPTSGATGPFVYGVNLGGDYPASVGDPSYLTSRTVDLSEVIGTTLRFQRWLNVEGPPEARAMIEISRDGVSWIEVWSNANYVMDDAWSLQTCDLSAVADGHDGVAVRWGYEILGPAAVPCSGWNIDDVEIWAMSQATARIALTVGREALDWTPVAGAMAYDVVQGDLAALQASGGDFTQATLACLADEVAGVTLPCTDGPQEEGEGWWYLVRGVSASGPMTYQSLHPSQQGVRDDEIEVSGAACP
jgi:hypothetical protein